MRHITALIIAITILAGAQTAQADSGKAIGTLAGATIGSLTFKNKISGAAIGAGVGLLVGTVVEHEMDRYDSGRQHRTARRPVERVVTVVEERPPRHAYGKRRWHKSHRRDRFRDHRRDHRFSDRRRHRAEHQPIRERRVTTHHPNGKVRVVETTIYR